MAEDKVETPTPDAAPRASKFPLILQAVNLLATAAIGGLVFMQASQASVTEEEAAVAQEPVERTVVKLDPFVVNLNEEGSSRYLKTTVEVELSSSDAAEHLQTRLYDIRDDLLGYFSGLAVADTLGERNKDAIRAEMVRRASAYLPTGALRQIYFAEFVVQ